MAKNYIKADLEFFDVISAFPALKEVLEKQQIDISHIEEGVTIYEYLKNTKLMDEKEIDLFIKKINLDLNAFLSDGTCNVMQSQMSEEMEFANDESDKIEEEEE